MTRVDRSKLTEAEAYHLDDANQRMKERRERNQAAGACINETRKNTHGFATHGVRCHRCYLTHKHGTRVAHSMPEYKVAKPVYPVVATETTPIDDIKRAAVVVDTEGRVIKNRFGAIRRRAAGNHNVSLSTAQEAS